MRERVKALLVADNERYKLEYERYKLEYQMWKEFQEQENQNRGESESQKESSPKHTEAKQEEQSDGELDSTKETSPSPTKPKHPKTIVPTMWTMLKAAECHPFLIESHMKKYLTQEDVLRLIEIAREYEGPSHIRENIQEILKLRDHVAEKEREQLKAAQEGGAKNIALYVRADKKAGASHGECYWKASIHIH
jgi:hypothetical protein